MVAVTFALPEESRDFRRVAGAVAEAGGGRLTQHRGRIAGREVLIAHTGVGLASAADCANRLLAAHRPEMLISAGFAGGLDPALAIGDLVVATNCSDANSIARARAIAGARCFFGALHSATAAAETIDAKAALARATSALAVDMETAAIAAACAGANVPLLAVRAISDRAGDPLPVPFAEWFDLEHQSPRPARLVAWLIRHPGRIAPFYRFVRGLGPARRALSDFLIRFLTAQN